MTNNLPEIFDTFADSRKSGFLSMKEEKDNGRHVVGTFCTYTPRELIYAADAIAVSLCSVSDETIPEAEKYLPKNLCPLVKASYGFAITDKCPYMYFSDLIVGETTCDAKKKMYELLGEMKDTYVMQLPQMPERESSLLLWKNEVEGFRKKLESKFNIKITDEKLKDAIKLCNEEREALKEFYMLGKLKPSPLTGMNMHSTLNASNFQFNRRKYIENIKEMTEKLKETYKSGESPFNKNTPRILITGCPTGGVAEKIIKQIEDVGASVVCFENCVGTKSFENLVDENKDPIEAIAERYLKIPCSVMSPNDGRMKNIERYIDEYSIDGVIDVTLTACHTFAVECEKVKRTVNSLGKSYLAIETNYSTSDSGQLRTRLEAFVEML